MHCPESVRATTVPACAKISETALGSAAGGQLSRRPPLSGHRSHCCCRLKEEKRVLEKRWLAGRGAAPSCSRCSSAWGKQRRRASASPRCSALPGRGGSAVTLFPRLEGLPAGPPSLSSESVGAGPSSQPMGCQCQLPSRPTEVAHCSAVAGPDRSGEECFGFMKARVRERRGEEQLVAATVAHVTEQGPEKNPSYHLIHSSVPSAPVGPECSNVAETDLHAPLLAPHVQLAGL